MADEITKLMTDQLRDAYSAEKQALRAMPRMLKQATAPALKEAIQRHIDQTGHQVERLERALARLGARPGRKVCEGMRGLIEEAQGEMQDHERGPLMDVLIVAAAQRVEHYEIAAYGTMVALAKAAGEQPLADLLAETLAEEKETDAGLSQLAESEINPVAIQEGRQAAAANDPGARGRGGRAA